MVPLLSHSISPAGGDSTTGSTTGSEPPIKKLPTEIMQKIGNELPITDLSSAYRSCRWMQTKLQNSWSHVSNPPAHNNPLANPPDPNLTHNPELGFGLKQGFDLLFKDDGNNLTDKDAKRISDLITSNALPSHQKLEVLHLALQEWLTPLIRMTEEISSSEEHPHDIARYRTLFDQMNDQIKKWPDSITDESGKTVELKGLRQIKDIVIFSLAKTIVPMPFLIAFEALPFYTRLLEHDPTVNGVDIGQSLTSLFHLLHNEDLPPTIQTLVANGQQPQEIKTFFETIRKRSPVFESIALQGLGKVLPFFFLSNTTFTLTRNTFNQIAGRSAELKSEYKIPIDIILKQHLNSNSQLSTLERQMRQLMERGQQAAILAIGD